MKVSKFIRVASTYNFHPNFRFYYFSEEIEQNLIEPISVPFATHQLALQNGIHPTSMQGVTFALAFDRAQEWFAND